MIFLSFNTKSLFLLKSSQYPSSFEAPGNPDDNTLFQALLPQILKVFFQNLRNGHRDIMRWSLDKPFLGFNRAKEGFSDQRLFGFNLLRMIFNVPKRTCS